MMSVVFNAAQRFSHTVTDASLASCTLFSSLFRQPAEKALQRLNLDGGGGALSRVFFDHFAQVRLEDALGAQERIGGIRGRLQTELINQLVVGGLRCVIEDRLQQTNAKHLLNVAASWLVFARVLAIR